MHKRGKSGIYSYRFRTTGTHSYGFKAKNFVFHATTGELSANIVGSSDITLSSNLESFSGSGTAKILNASGTLIETENFTITGNSLLSEGSDYRALSRL